MKICLPDVNILLALVTAGHTHHASARDWYEAQENDTVAICRVTQMGLLRLLTNPNVLPSGVCTILRAWDISNEILADRRAFFEYEPPGLEAEWRSLVLQPSAGSSSWTDAYLAAFARQHDFEMVTFDQGFRRWANLSLTILVQAAK